MPDNRKQHVVPRFYLSLFTDPQGRLHVFDRISGKTFSGKPEQLGIESECYTVWNGGVRDMSADEVNKEVESFCGQHLGGLSASACPSVIQWRAIWIFTANLLLRSRHVRDQQNDEITNLMNKLDKIGCWNFLARLDDKLGDAKEVLERAKDVSHAAVVGAGLPSILDELHAKPCQLLAAAIGTRFITSDDPVLVFQNDKPTVLRIASGAVKDDSISIVLPLKQDLACRWGSGVCLDRKMLSVADVERLNTQIYSRAYRQGYSAHPNDLAKAK